MEAGWERNLAPSLPALLGPGLVAGRVCLYWVLLGMSRTQKKGSEMEREVLMMGEERLWPQHIVSRDGASSSPFFNNMPVLLKKEKTTEDQGKSGRTQYRQ